jgi:hypothetical protein
MMIWWFCHLFLAPLERIPREQLVNSLGCPGCPERLVCPIKVEDETLEKTGASEKTPVFR